MSNIKNASKQTAGNLAVSIRNMIQTVEPMVTTLINALNTAIVAINKFFAILGGKSTMTVAKKQTDDYTKSLNKTSGAAKKLDRQLASFDELNILQEQSGGTSSLEDTADMFEEIDLGDIKSPFEGIFDVFKTAWENEGAKTVQAIKDSWESIKTLIGSVGDSFRTVFENGTGLKTLELMHQIVQNIAGAVGGLADSFRRAWEENETGTRIIQHIWDAFNDVLSMIERITAATKEWAQNLDFGPLLQAVETLTAKFEPLVKIITEGLLWAYENVLLPIEKWRIEEALPAIIDAFAAALDFLRAVLEKLKPVGQWLYDNFLVPIGNWVGDTFISAIETITSTLQKLTDLLDGNKTFGEFLDGLSLGETLALSFGTAIGVVTAAGVIYNAVIAAGTAISAAFGAAMAFITSPIALVTAAIAGVIAIGILLYQHWDEISAWIKKTWESVKNKTVEVWGSVKDFLSRTWENIKTSATNAWNSLKTKVANIFDKLRRKVLEIGGEIKDKVSKKWDELKENTSRKWNDIKTTISNLMGSVKNGIMEKVNAAKNWGKDLIDNFVSGIRQKWNDLKSTVSSVAKTVWDYLHFSEPEKGPLSNFHTFGRDMMQLYAKSIKDEQGTVLKTVSTLAAAVSDEMNGNSVGINASGVNSAVQGFNNRIADGVYSLVDTLQAIADNVTFRVPNIAMGTVLPARVAAAAASDGGYTQYGGTVSAYNDEELLNTLQDILQAVRARQSIKMDGREVTKGVVENMRSMQRSGTLGW